ncbi:MAG: methyltransferase [Chthoniobacteraceae bacterium]
MKSGNATKELYKQLRALPWPQLWEHEVPQFDRAEARARFERVAVVRAVGVVFSESGPPAQREAVKQWLVRLLGDPEEKIRRYAMAALPKIGVGAREEAELLALLRKTTNEREEKFLTRTLGRVGGAATLDTLEAAGGHSVQRVKATVARAQRPTIIRMDRHVSDISGMRIHLRGRRGLEGIVREEVEARGKFRVVEVSPGLVAITPLAAFTLDDVFELRCFDTVGFVLGEVKSRDQAELIEALAATIASPASRRLLETLTDGAIRYRLDFIGRGHQRGAVREVAERAFALCPLILNDARQSPWAVDIHPAAAGHTVELRPRFAPDPRHAWRLDDVPAASHPPLAACMARLAGPMEREIAWDPFCGSALELIERSRLGGVLRVHGTDHDADAIRAARANFAAARLDRVESRFTCCDFREFPTVARIAPRSLTLIITNPPLGRRLQIPNLRGLFEDLFAVAADLLAPGGRLVFTNPLRMDSPEPTLKLQSSQAVDLGGFDCRLEVYRKSAAGAVVAGRA